jgi:hypothetical protein
MMASLFGSSSSLCIFLRLTDDNELKGSSSFLSLFLGVEDNDKPSKFAVIYYI